MRTGAVFGVLILLLAGAAGFAQQRGQLVRGEPVVNPEAISGVWLAPDGHGGWVEMRLEIAAMLALGGSLADGPFLLAHVSLGMCHGRRSPMSFGECNYFSDDPDGGVRLGQSFLQVHLPAWGDSPREDVELVRDGEVWSGTWRRGNWFGRVHLERGMRTGLSGTWRSAGGECLHLADDADGLVASLDQLHDPRGMRYANGLRPQPLYESFGRMVGAERDKTSGVLSFEIGSAAAMVRTIRMRPRVCLVGRRRQIVLTGMRAGDGRYAEPDWMRVRGGSCRGR